MNTIPTPMPKFQVTLMHWNDASVTVTGEYEAPTMDAAICAAKNEHGWIAWTFLRGEKV